MKREIVWGKTNRHNQYCKSQSWLTTWWDWEMPGRWVNHFSVCLWGHLKRGLTNRRLALNVSSTSQEARGSAKIKMEEEKASQCIQYPFFLSESIYSCCHYPGTSDSSFICCWLMAAVSSQWLSRELLGLQPHSGLHHQHPCLRDFSFLPWAATGFPWSPLCKWPSQDCLAADYVHLINPWLQIHIWIL